MGYTIEDKQGAVVESVLLATKQAFAASEDSEQSARNQINTQSNVEIYFQIED